MLKLKYSIIFLLLITSVLSANVNDLSVNAKTIVLQNLAEIKNYNAGFYNPSLNVFSRNNYIYSSSYIPMENDENIMQASFSMPTAKANLGINYSKFVSKGVENWSENNTFLGNKDYNQNLLAISYAQKSPIGNFDFGFRFNLEEAKLGSEKIYSKKFWDIGFNKIITPNFAIGASAINLGDNEQQKFGLGINTKYYLNWYLSIFTTDEWTLATQKNISENLDIFLSLNNNLFDPYMDALSGIKLGFSLNFNKITIDYAFAKRGELGYLNYLTLNFIINKTPLKQKKEKENLQKSETQQINEPYKIFVYENPHFKKIKNYITKYLQTNKNINIIENINIDPHNFDIYASTKTLPAHIFVKYNITEKNHTFELNIEFFDIYQHKIIKNIKTEFYSDRGVELIIRNLILSFLDENDSLIQKNITKKEDERIQKILQNQQKIALIQRKKLAKLEKIKKFENSRQKRIEIEINKNIFTFKIGVTIQ